MKFTMTTRTAIGTSRLTIGNRGDWPDWFVVPVVRWIMARTRIDWPYEFTIKSTTRPFRWMGRGGVAAGYILISRRIRSKGWPYTFTDRRFKWSPAYTFANHLELFVFLAAHEIEHATRENRQHFKRGRSDGRRNEAGAEYRTNESAKATVEAFRAEWPAIRARILAERRRDRERSRATALRRGERERLASTTAAKIGAAEAMIAAWERKARRAETMIAKYRRKIRSLRAAETRRARRAATPGSKE